ncbi:hypothetical protein MTsPCn9_04490 [Croceitalea sp. MTPC9]|uniref:PorP/SprF family type IX secretion system membrane protein n=1 Tax=unclassified Croceitalea TaxID=2632280 RepID=UPI002B3C53B7|nr:hypothetical protein MTsPCn6_04220 [Croceitalea sp. MTPC6]GMN15513.1 hypothetical protein MTsPCn9_04490 [Croceitalea sp. MTPC9]
MQKIIVVSLILLFSCKVFGQEAILPNDFRQHSLTQFNSSLLNATNVLDWNNPRSLSLWTRWQWQSIDGDPTSLFLNYSHSFSSKTGVGLGFLQHNTGTFLNTGGILNFAQAITLKENINLIVGANVYLFTQEVADDRFDPDMDVSGLEGRNDFVAQFSPSVRLNINRFNIAASLENTLDYNFSQSEIIDNSKIFVGTISNDFPIVLFPSIENNFIRPVFYVRSIPDYDMQYGGNLLLSTSKFWVQGGYNNFYGPSGGIGGTFFNTFSIGALVEFGTSTELTDEELTFELVASYHFGKPNRSEKIVDFDDEDQIETKEEVIEEPIQPIAQEQLEQKKQLEQEEIKERLLKKQQDSILLQEEKNAQLIKQKARLDSINKLQLTKEVDVLPNEKYEEVTSTTIDGLTPGFYLIANVFGTKKYFEAFMKSMTDKGLEPKSFYRSQNKFNYVYLGKYNTIEEARRNRNSKLNGKYQGKTWIFRVKK